MAVAIGYRDNEDCKQPIKKSKSRRDIKKVIETICERVVMVLGISMLFIMSANPTKENKFNHIKTEIMSSQKLTIVARILAKPEKRELVKSELLKLIDITRAEKGCINYDLHHDNENQNLFLFYENWENRELWQTHMNNSHLAEYMKATDGAVEEFILNEMTQIE